MNYKVLSAMACLVCFSCSSGTIIKNVDAVSDISKLENREKVTYDNARDVINAYTALFTIPDPLYSGNSSSSYARRMNQKLLGNISCRAVLLNDYSTEADIIMMSLLNAGDDSAMSAFRKQYIEENVRDGMFRIRITMQSGFSEKSMDPEHWALYLENTRGVMIEPTDIVVSEPQAAQDSVYSDYSRVYLRRNVLSRDITCYFKRITFFGEDLFSENNPFITFVISHEQKTVARIAWNFSSKKERVRVKENRETDNIDDLDSVETLNR